MLRDDRGPVDSVIIISHTLTHDFSSCTQRQKKQELLKTFKLICKMGRRVSSSVQSPARFQVCKPAADLQSIRTNLLPAVISKSESVLDPTHYCKTQTDCAPAAAAQNRQTRRDANEELKKRSATKRSINKKCRVQTEQADTSFTFSLNYVHLCFLPLRHTLTLLQQPV